MALEQGDRVQFKNKKPNIFGTLLVMEVNGPKATCFFNLVDTPADSNKRSVSFRPVIDEFDVESLELVEKGEN